MTTTGPLRDRPLLHPAVQDRRPERGDHLQPRQRRPDADQRAVVDAGFLELTRLGMLPADDPDVLRLAARRRRRDPPGHRQRPRASTATARRPPGTEDGYGDCYEPDADELHRPRQAVAGPARAEPAPATSGRCCPASGPSSSCRPATPATAPAAARRWQRLASGIGLMPEQAWENPDLAASPFGTDPSTRRSASRTARRPAAPRR